MKSKQQGLTYVSLTIYLWNSEISNNNNNVGVQIVDAPNITYTVSEIVHE